MTTSATIELRAHHLLCTVLYQGKGYSEEFTNNMNRVVGRLFSSATNTVILKKSPDKICSSCPNHLMDGGCSLDSKNAHISDIDSLICAYFDFPFDVELSKFYVLSTILNTITPDFFEQCCGNCRWKKAGICSYQAYINSLKLKLELTQP